MKKLSLITTLFICVSHVLFAQWTPNGTSIYYNNNGNVGIANTNPQSKLTVSGVITTENFGFLGHKGASGTVIPISFWEAPLKTTATELLRSCEI